MISVRGPTSVACATRESPCEPSRDPVVSTRRLIVAALACGLAILTAGVAFFVRLVANRGDLTVATIYTIGQPARVGDAAVTVRSSATVGGQLQVIVTVDRGAAKDPAGPAADGPWSLVQGSLRPKVAPAGLATASATGAVACSRITLDPDRIVTCTLAFTPASGPAFVAFEWQDGRARWRL